jgi:hypothetical protein
VLPEFLPPDAPEPKTASKSHELLRPWLELANLLPPPPLRTELKGTQDVLVSILRVNQWEAECYDLLAAEIVRRFESSPLVREAAKVASLDLQELRTSEEEARFLCRLVAEIASTLRTLVAAPSPKVLERVGEMLIKRLDVNPGTSRSEIWVCNGLVVTSLVDPYKDFLTALAGVELARLRRCGICAHFFFALRKDQKACSKRCNAIRRVRDWRANQAQHEYRRKLRGAGLLARKKSGRRRS